MTDDQSIALKQPQGSGQHPLSDAMHASADVRVAQLTIDAKGVDHAERPSTTCVRQDLSA